MQWDEERLAAEVEGEIARRFEYESLTAAMRTGFGATTITLKQCIGALGRRLGFKVAASGFVGADEGEWLYDMVWYDLDERGYLKRQILVLESELNPDPEIDGDFQKLVQARADVRVWISCAGDQKLARQHIANCKRQAELFSGSVSGDTYILVTDNWTNPNIEIERFVITSTPPR